MKCLSSFLLFFLVLLASSVYADKRLVLNTVGKPPLNNSDKTGFLDIIASLALKRIGYTLETVKLPAERGLKNANAGIEDGEMARVDGITDFYPNLIKVPEKILDWEFAVFSKTKLSLNKGWNSFKDKDVAFINGWKILEINIPRSNVNILKVKEPEQLFSLLEKKRTDFIIFEKWGGLFLKNKSKDKSIVMLPEPLIIKSAYIYLHKKHKAIIPKLTASLKQIKEEGTYSKIFNEILSPLQK